MKQCKRCNENKDISFFSKDRSRKDGLHPYCKFCKSEIDKVYREKNEKKIKKIGKEYYKKNRKQLIKKQAEYYSNNKDKAILYREKNKDKKALYNKTYKAANLSKTRKQETKRYQEDIQFRLKKILRSRLRAALKNNQKKGSAVKDLGCTIDFLKNYLENQFAPGMTWENQGEWEIDHIIPLSAFDLQDPKQLKKACHYKNLQPLWKHENLKKSNKLRPEYV